MTRSRIVKTEKVQYVEEGDYLFFTCAFRKVEKVLVYPEIVDIRMEKGSNITELKDTFVLLLGQGNLRKELEMDRADALKEMAHMEEKGTDNPPIEDTVLHQEAETQAVTSLLGATITGLGVPTDYPVVDKLKRYSATLIDHISEIPGDSQEKSVAINHIRSGYLHARLAHADSLIQPDPVGITPDGYK